MVDTVTNHVNDLIKRIKTLPQVTNKVVYVYDQEELLNSKHKLAYPALGVIYVGLKGIDDSSGTGLATNLVCDIYLLGADSCGSNTKIDIEKAKSTKLLDDIRDSIKCGIAPSKRKWKFILESPIDLGENILSYVQRWETIVLLS